MNKSYTFQFLAQDDPTESKRLAAFWAIFSIVVGLVALLTLSDLPWRHMMTAIGHSFYLSKCSEQSDNENADEKDLRASNSTFNEPDLGVAHLSLSDGVTIPKRIHYNVMNTVWNPEKISHQTPANDQHNRYCSPKQNTAPDRVLIQSFAAVMTKEKQGELEDKSVHHVNQNKSTNLVTKTKDPVHTMVSLAQQLQEQLKDKRFGETSSLNSSKTNDG